MSPSSSPHARTDSRGSERSSGAGSGAGEAFDDTVCAFWLGARCYAISASLVGEIVSVESVAAVPLAAPAVLGIFNLRGAPVALVDASRALDLPGIAVGPQPGAVTTALVVRRGNVPLAGLAIDRMDAVMTADQCSFTPRDWDDDHAAVAGFIEASDAQRNLRGHVITLFDSAVVIERLLALRYR